MFEDGGGFGFGGGMTGGGMPGMGGGLMQNGMKELMLKQQQQQMMQQRQRFAELDKIRANAWKTMGNVHDQFVGSGKMSSQQFWNQPWAQTYMGGLRDITKGMGLPDDVDGRIAGLSQKFSQAGPTGPGSSPAPQEHDGQSGPTGPGNMPVPQFGHDASPTGPGNVQVPQLASQKHAAVTGGEALPKEDASAISPPKFNLATANPNGSPFPGVENDRSGKMPTAFIMHHTGGRGDPAGVVNDWRQHRPGIGTQFIMDRQGNIHDVRQELSYRGTGNIITGSGKGKGLNNSNIVGMEVIAKNNKDVTPEQIASAVAFIHSRYPNTPVFGHGEVNPGHREADEGMAIVSQIRAMREGKEPQIQTAQADTQKGPVPGTDAYYAQHPEKGTGKGPDYAAPWRDKTQPPSLGKRSGLGSPALQTIGAGRNAITVPGSMLNDGVYRGGLGGQSSFVGGGLFQRAQYLPGQTSNGFWPTVRGTFSELDQLPKGIPSPVEGPDVRDRPGMVNPQAHGFKTDPERGMFPLTREQFQKQYGRAPQQLRELQWYQQVDRLKKTDPKKYQKLKHWFEHRFDDDDTDGFDGKVHSAPRFKNPQMDDPYYGVGGPADKFKSQPGLSGTGQFPPYGAGQTAPQQTTQPPQAAPVAQSSFVTSGQLPPLPDNQLKVFGNEKNEVFRFMTPYQFDFMAMQYAKGNSGGLPKTGRNKDIALLDQMLIARATDYWKSKGLSADDANNAMIEFQAKKAGTRKIAQMQAQTIVALDKAENSAPVVIERSKDVPRTEYPLINSIIMAAKEQTGDTKVIRFGQAMETLISNYASALANGNSVITDHMRKKAESILQKSWSEGQVQAGVDQLLVEIDREKQGTMQAMPEFLNQGQKQEPTRDPSKMSDDELKKALGIQ